MVRYGSQGFRASFRWSNYMAAVMITEPSAPPRSRFPEPSFPAAQGFRLRVVADPTPRIPTIRRVTPATFRRRRLGVLLGMAVVVVVAGRAGAVLGSESLVAPERAPSVVRYVAQGGDSLWTAAHRLAPDHDPREVVDALVHVRGNGPLMPGEVLRWQR